MLLYDLDLVEEQKALPIQQQEEEIESIAEGAVGRAVEQAVEQVEKLAQPAQREQAV